MAVFQFSETLRNNRLNQVETTLGGAPKLRIMSGAKPAGCNDADNGTMLCEITLPSDWMTTASGGVKIKNGVWTGTADALAGGGTTATHFRLKNSAGTLVHIQGDITTTGGGGAMTINDTNVVAGQPVTVTSFTLTDGNS
jgi:hypothetical protein